MVFVEPVTLTSRGVSLVPLTLAHEEGLRAAAADGSGGRNGAGSALDAADGFAKRVPEAAGESAALALGALPCRGDVLEQPRVRELGDAGTAGIPVVHEDRGVAGLRVHRHRHAADLPGTDSLGLEQRGDGGCRRG